MRLTMPVLCALLCAFCVHAADWELQATSEGTLAVSYRGSRVAGAKYVFWAANWKFAAPKVGAKSDGDGGYTLGGSVPGLGLTLNGSIKRASERQLIYRYDWTSAEAKADVIGGGLEFALKLGPDAFEQAPPEPVLLEGGKGWRWEAVKGQALEVTFDPPVGSIFFEKGRKDTIRTFFFAEKVAAGQIPFTMTVTLPEGGEVVASLDERYGPEPLEQWPLDALHPDESPVDLRFLNHTPAGKHGFVKADGERLVFADGTPVKFWGANVQAYALFRSSKDALKKQAERIAKLGFNLIRLHHHDSGTWVKPCLIDLEKPHSHDLDAQALDNMHWFVKCLKDEGVYVWIDIHVGRPFKSGDEIPNFDEMARKGKNGTSEGKGFCYYNARIAELMREFAEKYLGAANPHTGLALKDEPAVMGLLLTNENDLVYHFGNALLPDKGVPAHTKIFQAEVGAFCARTGLPPDETWKTWIDGPAKLFLLDKEHQFFETMLGHLEGFGVKPPVAAGHIWGGMGMGALYSLARGGIVDCHSYGGDEALSADPRTGSNFLHTAAGAQLYGKPFAITEYNIGHYPGRDRFTMPVYWAAVGALQGWDAPMLYGYSQDIFGTGARGIDNWSSYGDPGVTAAMPAAALFFRRDVQEAKQTVMLRAKRETALDKKLGGEQSRAVRTLMETHRVTIGLEAIKELPWVQPTAPAEGVETIDDPHKSYLAAEATEIVSDTGELKRELKRGVQTVVTPGGVALQGWLGEAGKLTAGPLSVESRTPKALLALNSLTAEPLTKSTRVLLTAVARVRPIKEENASRFHSEPVRATLRFASEIEGLQLVPCEPDGKPGAAIPLVREDGAYRIELPAAAGVHWWMLTK